MKKALTLALVIMVAASLVCVFAPQSFGQDVSLTEDVQVTSYTTYISPNTGAFVIVGEVQNVGTQYFHSARIRAVVYNSSDTYIAEPIVTYTYADQLAPGETAGFYMLFTAASSLTGDLSWVESGIDHIEFYAFGGADDTPQDSGVHVIAQNGAVTANGNYTVTGMVLNRGTEYPEKYFVVGTFYDASGKVIAIGISEYLDRYLAPNNVTSFFCGLYDAQTGIGNQIANFTLRTVVETSVTEAPTPTPSTTANPTASPGTSTNPTTTTSASPSGSDNTGSSNTLYIVIAVVGIVVAVVVLVLLLRRR